MTVIESLAGQGQVSTAFDLTELTALVGITGYNPNFINPEAFRQNDIVAGDWVLNKPVLAGGVQTAFSYTKGLEVIANPDFLRVTQKGDLLTASEYICHQVVSRYVDTAPSNIFHLVGFDLEARVRLLDGAEANSPLRDLRSHMELNDAQPELDLRAAYEYENHEIVLFWTENLDSLDQAHPHLDLTAQFRFQVDGEEDEQQKAYVQEVLTSLAQRVQEFRTLSQQLVGLYRSGDST